VYFKYGLISALISLLICRFTDGKKRTEKKTSRNTRITTDFRNSLRSNQLKRKEDIKSLKISAEED